MARHSNRDPQDAAHLNDFVKVNHHDGRRQDHGCGRRHHYGGSSTWLVRPDDRDVIHGRRWTAQAEIAEGLADYFEDIDSID